LLTQRRWTSAVGWAKAMARDFLMAKTLVRRAHAVIIRNCARARGHGAREASSLEAKCHRLCPPYQTFWVALTPERLSLTPAPRYTPAQQENLQPWPRCG